jgi:TRAP-type mannitol/chloroaromatic compound transport system permease large subunit
MNLQTSFLTPPFGFALFYLRSVAARVPYLDRITGKNVEGIKTSEIYAGAIPFIVLQVFMIGVVIAFPQIVMHYKGEKIDPSTVTITVPTLQPLGGISTGGLPTLGAPLINPP